jgi:alpha-L-fucosidase
MGNFAQNFCKNNLLLMKKSLKVIALALAFVPGTSKAQNVVVETGSFQPSWESLSAWECPEWFKNAKFGIWAHWGPQCAAEDGDWYARGMYQTGSAQNQYHIAKYGDPSEFGLKDLCNSWKAENWNPDELISLYKSVGARYFFTLGQHHDNFDLWNSPYQEWNSVKVGPRKDIVKGWSDACKKYGLPLGISMHGSHTWTWLEPSQDYDGNLTKADGKGKWWEGMDPQELYAQRHARRADGDTRWDWDGVAELPSEAYKMKFQNRVLECINDYNPDILYFDDTVLPFYGCDEQIGLNILADYYNHSAAQHNGTPQVVATGKVLQEKHKKAMMWDVERGVPDAIQNEYWQTCTCIGSWHYDRNIYNNNGYKSAQQVVDMLVDIVSKNGNLLLSIPVRGDGTIDEKERAILDDIKAWMDQNSLSIYSTRTWKTFGEGPLADKSSGTGTQGFNESNNYSAKDVRYAQRNDSLFATIMRWPNQASFTFKNLGYASQYYSGKVKSVSLLGYGAVKYNLDINGLTVSLPNEPVNKIAPVFVINFEGNTGQVTTLSLSQLIPLYEEQIDSLRKGSSYLNTGKLSPENINAFVDTLNEAKTHTEADSITQEIAKRNLAEAYNNLLTNGVNQGSAPRSDELQNLTVESLKEAEKFARTDTSNNGKRFGTPKYWTTENFKIPNGNNGVKNGIDHYPGYDCLALGVWDDQKANEEGSLANARIYQRVHLEPGLYYFGAAYNTTYGLSSDAYIFAANDLYSTNDLTKKSIAAWPINKVASGGTFTGLNFLIDKEQDVILGFQADLTGSSEQEFRVQKVILNYYGVMDYNALNNLVLTADGLMSGATVNSNTGYYSKEAVEQLREALDRAEEVKEDASSDEIIVAYYQLSAAVKNFQENGVNDGGQPSTSQNEDLTTEMLLEANHFSRADETVTTRFATPKNWTVENYNIPGGNSGVKNGLDKYPGYDCLNLGIWDDRDNNTDGDIENARVYRTVKLKPGRYYFGAKYQTTYNLTSKAYIYAAEGNVNSRDITTQTIAYYPIIKATDNSNFWGIFFNIEKEQNVNLGFQANLKDGNAEQEFRASDVKLLYYGEITFERLTSLIGTAEQTLTGVKINNNTGFYNRAAVNKLQQAIDAAKQMKSSSTYEEIALAYDNLEKAIKEFETNGKNDGGQPETIGSTDITTDKLVEASEFSLADETVTTRFATPKYWTVENFMIPNGNNGTKNGLDKNPGYECLYLGLWDDRDQNTEGDLTNARIYRKVHLAAGRYYFGASYHTTWGLGDKAYIYAATENMNTDEIPQQSIAYYRINKAGGNDGKLWGIYFDVEKEQDIILGFQADLQNGNAEGEFRAKAVSLLYYGNTTGIETIDNDKTFVSHNVQGIFDLSGRKVGANATSKLKKGIYIINGKKMVIR